PVERLRELIAIKRTGAIETAIADRSGRVLAYEGVGSIDGRELMEAYQPGVDGHVNVRSKDTGLQVSYLPSERYDWVYVAMADMQVLRQPAQWIQTGSAVFLLFVLVV